MDAVKTGFTNNLSGEQLPVNTPVFSTSTSPSNPPTKSKMRLSIAVLIGLLIVVGIAGYLFIISNANQQNSLQQNKLNISPALPTSTPTVESTDVQYI